MEFTHKTQTSRLVFHSNQSTGLFCHRCPNAVIQEVLKHVLKIDVLVCTKCVGTLKAVAAVRDPNQIARYLKHVGLGSDPLKLAVVKLR